MAQSHVSVKVRDSEGSTATTVAYVNVDDTVVLGDARTAFGTWLGLLKNATGGRIVEAALKLDLDVTGHAADPIVAGIAVADGIAAIFPNTSEAPWDFLIPARQPNCMLGSVPDPTEGATLDLLSDFMEVAIAGLTASNFTTNLGADLAASAAFRRNTRTNRKQLARKSSVTGA